MRYAKPRQDRFQSRAPPLALRRSASGEYVERQAHSSFKGALSPPSWARFLFRSRFRSCPSGFSRFTHLEAGVPSDNNVFPELGDPGGDQLTDSNISGAVLDEVLLIKTVFFIKLPKLPFNDSLHHLRGLAASRRLRAKNFALALKDFRRHVFAPDKFGVRGANLHCQVMDQLLELRIAGHEIRLAVDFDDHADLTPGMNVAADKTFRCGPARLLGGNSLAALSQNRESLIQVAARFIQGLLALHHGRAAYLAQLLDRIQ